MSAQDLDTVWSLGVRLTLATPRPCRRAERATVLGSGNQRQLLALFVGLPSVLRPVLRVLWEREEDRESRLPPALGIFPGGDGSVCLQLHHPLKKV